MSALEAVCNELGPTVDELVQVARDAGEQTAKRRAIRYWVSQGLVLSPRRSGREWRYPNASIGQVDTLARWRQRRIDPRLIRFALFIEVGTVAADDAAEMACEFLATWEESLEIPKARVLADPEAMRDEAAKAARMRGRAPLPHRVRVSLDERTLAMTYALAGMFSVPLLKDEEERGQHQFERVIGLRSGRGGAERDLSEITLKPNDWPTDTAALVDAVATASPERIEFARRGVECAVAWMPALRSTFAAVRGPSAAPLVDILEEWAERITPEAYVLMFSVFTSNASKRATNDQIRECLQVLYPETLALGILDERPASDWDVVSRRLRPYQRLRFERFRAGLGRR